MNFKGCYRNPMNRLALGFFIAALVCFGVFHFASIEGEAVMRGWHMWSNIYVFFSDGSWKREFAICVAFGSFLRISLLVVTGPLLVPVLGNNRIAAWFYGLISFAAFAELCAFYGSGRLIDFFLVVTSQPSLSLPRLLLHPPTCTRGVRSGFSTRGVRATLPHWQLVSPISTCFLTWE